MDWRRLIATHTGYSERWLNKPLDVLPRIDAVDPAHPSGSVRAYCHDARMRLVTSQDSHMQSVTTRAVIDIPTQSSQESGVFNTPDGLPDQLVAGPLADIRIRRNGLGPPIVTLTHM